MLREASAPSAGGHGEGRRSAGRPINTIAADADADAIAAHVDGTFVVVVKVTGGKYRRRCFLTVKAAQAAAERATARGENAVVILSELRPLYRVIGGGPHAR